MKAIGGHKNKHVVVQPGSWGIRYYDLLFATVRSSGFANIDTDMVSGDGTVRITESYIWSHSLEAVESKASRMDKKKVAGLGGSKEADAAPRYFLHEWIAAYIIQTAWKMSRRGVESNDAIVHLSAETLGVDFALHHGEGENVDAGGHVGRGVPVGFERATHSV